MLDPNAAPANPQTNDATAPRTALSPLVFLKTALKEWVPSLLDQPAQPPFELNAQFRDESGRVARLITVALIVSIATVGGLSILGGFDVRALLTQAFTVIIACFLVAFAYRPFAYLCGVRLVHTDATQQ